MIERIKQIRNPLTIVAIFAGLAEISSAVVLPQLQVETQRLFVWFVMLFPVFLVLLFFITLNFNPRVLYAPSDYTNENNFMESLTGKKRLTASEVRSEEGEKTDEQ